MLGRSSRRSPTAGKDITINTATTIQNEVTGLEQAPPTYTFLHNGGSVVFIVVLFAACGSGPNLLRAADVKDRHARGYTHTYTQQAEKDRGRQ